MNGVEEAVGADFHQMMGRADFLAGDAADALEAAGWRDEAALLRTEVVGRNMLDGRWAFQVVEEFDDSYYGPTGAVERGIRQRVIGGRRRVFEAELEAHRRTRSTCRPGRPATSALSSGVTERRAAQ